MLKYGRSEIKRLATHLLDTDQGNWAFLEYKDRIEIWKVNDDGWYELHRNIKDKKAAERVYRVYGVSGDIDNDL